MFRRPKTFAYTQLTPMIRRLYFFSVFMLLIGVAFVCVGGCLRDPVILMLSLLWTFSGGVFAHVASILLQQRQQITDLQKRLDEVSPTRNERS
jgi:fatty acid desaturase